VTLYKQVIAITNQARRANERADSGRYQELQEEQRLLYASASDEDLHGLMRDANSESDPSDQVAMDKLIRARQLAQNKVAWHRRYQIN